MPHPIFRKSVCSLMAALIGFTQTATNVALAQDAAQRAETSTPPTTGLSVQDVGKQANALGKELGKKGLEGAPTFDGMNIGIKIGDENIQIDKNSLAPADNGKNIRYSHTLEDFEKQSENFDDGGALDETGTAQKDSLFADSKSETPTLEGEVYSILVDMAGKQFPDYSEEAFLDKTEEILADMDNVLQDLVTCDAKSALDTQSKYVHVEDLKQCQQVIDKTMTCTIEHNYSVGVVEHSDGPFNIKSCGEGCTEVWIGNPSDQNFKAPDDKCVLYEQLIAIRLVNPHAITNVSLVDVHWDDQMQIYFGEKGHEEVKLLQLPYPETFVPELDNHPGVRPVFEYLGPYSGAAHTSCQQKISWHWNTSLDVTRFFKDATPNSVYNFRIRVAVMDNGEGYAKLRINYDPKKIVDNDLWTPKDCVDAALAIHDGMAKGETKCVDMPEIGADGCAWINGASVCDEHLAESPLPGINKFCRKVEVNSEFVFNKGDTGCWQAMVGFDKDGNAIYEEVCGGQNLGGNLDTCAQYKENPDCKFVSSECTEGMTGASTGTCYVNDVVYDCGKDVKIEDVNAETTYDCDGIACLGEECIDVDRTHSTDFAKVNAILNALQYMAQDMECVGLDENGVPSGDQNVDCTVFGGKKGYCKIAVGGWQNCCDPVPGPGLSEYISMIQAGQRATAMLTSWTQNADKAAQAGAIGAEAAGSWAEAAGAVSNVLQNNTGLFGKAFGSVVDGIYTMVDFVAAPLKSFTTAVGGYLNKFIMKKIGQVFTDAGFENLGTVIGNVGGNGSNAGQQGLLDAALQDMLGAELGSAVGSVISFVGWVYLAYQVANLIVQLVYKCEEIEYQTVSQNKTKNCHYVGSYCKDKVLGKCIVKHRVYCCFQSPLSRIINQQVKATQPEILSNGKDWGTPKAPNCQGIALGDINKINWDLIDLEEWTALLVESGNMVTTDDINLDQLTGKDSKINWTGDYGTATDWGLPNAEMEHDISKPQAAALKAGQKPSDRLNTVERIEARLTDVDVDGLRTQGAPCISLEVGNGTVLRGGCGEMSNAEYVCRKNGALYDCEEIAYQNSLGELLGNKPTSQDYWDDGYRCYKGEVNIDCSTLYSKEAYLEALEEYARTIGGTTYLGRYVCVDKSGTFNKTICEHAMEQNYCRCLPGNFVCQDGNKPIACGSLGEIRSDCECLQGACDDTCEFGGIPKGMEDNVNFACSNGICPYGHTVNGQLICNTATCPYGM